MNLDLNVPFIQLDRSVKEEQNMGKAFANALASLHLNSLPQLKSLSWSLKLFAGESIDVDAGDLKMLKEFIDREKHPKIKDMFPPFLLGQIEEKLFALSE